MSKVALITGAGSGIGKTVALALGQKHYRLCLSGRHLASLQITANELISAGAPEPICISADVTQQSQVTRLFEETIKHFGRLDLLFNNAGISAPAVSLEELQSAAWLDVINTNLNGAFFCLQAAFRVMKHQIPQGGRIINNGSVSSVSPRPHSAPYTASKHAITGLTKSASLDGRALNIACCQIDIGNAASSMGERMHQGTLQANGTLLKEPIMDLQHVGDAVCYMDSLPLDSNVQFMTLMATQMPFIGRG